LNINPPWIYFTDAVLRAPTIGCMLMCFSAALVGVVAFIRKESLVGETLSHASYPGVILGALGAGMLQLGEEQEGSVLALIICGAFLTSFLGLLSVSALQKRVRIHSDSALCFVLSIFFGVGLTIASHLQFSHTNLYRQAQLYLYGQAATMTDIHILAYGALSFAMLALLLVFYKEIQALSFDPQYAESLGIKTKAVQSLIFLLLILAVIIGIRSVGVVLMSAMLIAPPAAARQFTHRLPLLFLLAALFGAASGFIGSYLSNELTRNMHAANLTLPTGPMIVIVASAFCLLALLFAPERGLLLRMLRIALFRSRCQHENLLKGIWRLETAEVPFHEIARMQSSSKWRLRLLLSSLVRKKLLMPVSNGYALTPKGKQKAVQIVRLHRLWEVYLVDYLGVGAERVHKNAEEMEHILTPELERELTRVLNNPQQDPHHQPIPKEIKEE
jgi:manganese/zinc/iron transport system permease protein